MSKSLKEVGLRDTDALRKRVMRDWAMKRISQKKCNRIINYIDIIENEIVKEEETNNADQGQDS